jgi:hypothetical protein
MTDDIRRVRMTREFEQDFLPDYEVANMPSADKRAAYALEHIAFRMSRIDKKLERLVAAIEAMIAKG